MKKIINWIGYDGLLHFLVCYAMILTFTPIIGLWWAFVTTVIASIGKELYDVFVIKSNDLKSSLHDVLFDAVGIGLSILILFL